MPQTLPRNDALADQLDLLADLSEILEEESFKVIAYRRYYAEGVAHQSSGSPSSAHPELWNRIQICYPKGVTQIAKR